MSISNGESLLMYSMLQELKRSKKEKMKDIIKAMEAFNENLVGGKRLVKALEKDTVIAWLLVSIIFQRAD